MTNETQTAADQTLDRIDRKILSELQKDCRISYTELASRVGLTASPCIERVRNLKKAGFIEAYVAVLNPKKFGRGMVVFVQVRLAVRNRESFDEFRRLITKLPEVQECYLVTGESDFFIKVRVSDIRAYKDFLEEKLLVMPVVQGSVSIVAMDTVKESAHITLSDAFV